MKIHLKIISAVLSILLIITLGGKNTKVNANVVYSQGYTRVYNVAYSGMVAKHNINDIEDLLDNEISFVPQNLDLDNYDEDWIEDAIDFIDSDLQNSTPSNVSFDEEEAKAAAFAYSMECANWSINQGRGSNFADECVYMFISHYIDRPEYYWSGQNYSYLLDGPSMSENTSYFSKWIVADDRTAYNTYLYNSSVIDGANSIKQVYDGLNGFYTSGTNYNNIVEAFERTSSCAQDFYVSLDGYLMYNSGVSDLYSGLSTIISGITANDAQSSLEYMYNQFIADEDLLINTSSYIRSHIIKDSIKLFASILIAEVVGGTSEIGDILFNYSYDTYMSIFNLAAYSTMRYSFHGREAQRYYDYLMNSYL